MDKFGQIGPEKGDYDRDVKAIADALNYGGRAVTLALTHRLTRQQVTVALKRTMEVCGADYGGGPPGTKGGDFAFVAVDEKGAYWFRVDMLTDPSYIVTKLGLNVVDAETLSDFLRRLGLALGHDPVVGHLVVAELVAELDGEQVREALRGQ